MSPPITSMASGPASGTPSRCAVADTGCLRSRSGGAGRAPGVVVLCQNVVLAARVQRLRGVLISSTEAPPGDAPRVEVDAQGAVRRPRRAGGGRHDVFLRSRAAASVGVVDCMISSSSCRSGLILLNACVFGVVSFAGQRNDAARRRLAGFQQAEPCASPRQAAVLDQPQQGRQEGGVTRDKAGLEPLGIDFRRPADGVA